MRIKQQAWDLYFPQSECNAGDSRMPVLESLVSFFSSNYRSYVNEVEVLSHERVVINFAVLEAEIPVAEFSSVLKDEPHTVIACLAYSLHHVISERVPSFGCSRKIAVRLNNYHPTTPFRALKSNFVDKFMCLVGNVVRVSNIKPLVTAMLFTCGRCDTTISQSFTDGKYALPQACEGRCKSRTFTPKFDSAATVDWQRIRLQEIVSSEQLDQGRIPRTIECELTQDLVESCVPGDVVSVTGIVKARKADQANNSRNRTKSLFGLYIDVNALTNRGKNRMGKLESISCTQSEQDAVGQIANEPDLFRKLIHSLCPGIYGHEVVKAGLLLALFGGCHKSRMPSSSSLPSSTPSFASSRGSIAMRGDPHVLIVGDPGLGKSQMLRAAANVAPRAVYVSGNSTTTTGLTVTMVREGKSGDFALEAGALVLADQGVCCIDEFDKMSSEHNALLEAMEQQSISIAKAGMVCSLAARCSVLAAANPVGGHYNRCKTVNENLKMSNPLLSRFDIIFILLDTPNEERDNMLSEHVLQIHSGWKKSDGDPSSHFAPPSKRRSMAMSSLSQWHDEKSLAERLAVRDADDVQELLRCRVPPPLLRKYIAYARQNIHPTLSPGAKRVLAEFYLKLRKEHHSQDSTPITTRQLESLIRLCEARAKAECRSVATEQDAVDVVELMRESLYDVLADEFGQVDVRRSSGMSKAKQIKAFMKAVKKVSEQHNTSIFSVDELKKLAKELNLGVENMDLFLQTLNHQNYILAKGGGKYQVQCVDF